ncbi:MAG: hypothetical protein JST81_01380 [Bacteroidetes bacterium]|nr:hypothetical protein [Bacteroidota bacterium]
MKAASLKEIKAELEIVPAQKLVALCLQLAKFKKENKELLTYLLFEESNEQGYIESVKTEIDEAFKELNIKSIYIAKKNLRRILRSVNRYIRYSGLKTTEATLLLYFCKKIKDSRLEIEKSQQLVNLFSAQAKKIKAAISGMHEDLQYDYRREMEIIL